MKNLTLKFISILYELMPYNVLFDNYLMFLPIFFN